MYCQINWFFPWPEEALIKLSRKFLDDIYIDCSPEIKEQLQNHMSTIHQKIGEENGKYYEISRKSVYVTPTVYLQYIELYKKIYQ